MSLQLHCNNAGIGTLIKPDFSLGSLSSMTVDYWERMENAYHSVLQTPIKLSIFFYIVINIILVNFLKTPIIYEENG